VYSKEKAAEIPALKRVWFNLAQRDFKELADTAYLLRAAARDGCKEAKVDDRAALNAQF